MRAQQFGKVLLVVGLALLVIWGARVAMLARSLQGHLAEAQAIADTKNVNPQVACELVRNLQSDLVGINQEAGALVSLAPAFGWLPNIGGDLQAAPHLLAMANGLSEAGSIVCAALAPMLKSNGHLSIENAAALLAANQADLQRAANAANRAERAWA